MNAAFSLAMEIPKRFRFVCPSRSYFVNIRRQSERLRCQALISGPLFGTGPFERPHPSSAWLSGPAFAGRLMCEP